MRKKDKQCCYFQDFLLLEMKLNVWKSRERTAFERRNQHLLGTCGFPQVRVKQTNQEEGIHSKISACKPSAQLT